MLLIKIICAYIGKVKGGFHMNGKEIKALIKKKRLFQWEVAEELHINEFTLSRWLRGSISKKQEEEILNAIERLTQKE